MNLPHSAYIIVSIFLLVVNIVWIITNRLNKCYKEKQLKKLKAEKENRKERYDERELRDEIPPQHWYAWVFSTCLCLNIWVVGAIVTHWWAGKYFTFIKEEDCNKALFGDSFGAVNALISAFAFAGMIVAFILQRYELRLQRKELEAQRKEFETQNDTLKLQRFENTFFHMMELQQQVVNDLYSKDNIKNWIEEDNPNPGMGTIRKQVNVEHIYQGRNLFYFKFAVDLHPIIDTKLMKGREVYGLGGVMTEKGFSQYDAYNT